MIVSIVILNWNGESYLRELLPHLISNTPTEGVEIVVADNASTDGSMALLTSDFSQLRTIVLDKNYGFAEGYNKALKQIDSQFYVLLNSDVEVTEGWLFPLLEYMNAHPEVAACQPKIMSYHQRNYFEHAGAAGGFIDRFGFPFCRGRILGCAEEDKGQYDSTIDVFWATGACLFIRSDAYWKVGGLDGEFFAHMEEIDLCWRLKNRGYSIVALPESKVYHVGGGTLGTESPFKTYLNFRNNLLLLYKNLPKQELQKIMFWRTFFDYAAALHFCITGKFSNAKSVLKARIDFRKMKTHFDEKRKLNLNETTQAYHPQIIKKSVVFLYYFDKIKNFSQLKW